MRQTYTIQENGQVTLPREWREKHGLRKGDMVSFVETEQGLVVVPREVIGMDALDRIGRALEQQGITLDDLITNGRKIRGEMAREKRRATSSRD
jgi:AbrB family looped-hinge helix DNA binding protein